MAASLLNFVLFQSTWFAAILGAAAGWPVAGSLLAMITTAVHLNFMTGSRLRESGVLLAVTLLGLAIEAAFIGGSVLRYAGTSETQILPPLWILAVWLAFATLPHASLRWLAGRWKLQALLGAVLGPLSYLAGAELGAATLFQPTGLSLIAIGIGWALTMPLIFLLAETINGDGQRPELQ